MHKYAIIGFGGLGKKHLANLSVLEKQRGDFCLCAISGADPNTIKENVKLNLGDVDISNIDFSKCNFYQDYKELIEVEKPDFILSTLPTYLHEEVAVFALNHGVHVFSEKPMALSIESCKNMIDAANKNGKKLMIGQCLRFSPVYEKLKEYVDNKTFGRAYRAEFVRYSQKPTWTWKDWILNPKQSGGCILDMHIHDVDLINWIFGAPKSLRSASTHVKAERESVFTQYFYDELLVSANADWSMPQTFPFTAWSMVNFENATVRIVDDVLTVYQDGESFIPPLSDEDCFVREMRAFLEIVIDDKPCEITSPESVMETVKIAIQEIQQSNED